MLNIDWQRYFELSKKNKEEQDWTVIKMNKDFKGILLYWVWGLVLIVAGHCDIWKALIFFTIGVFIGFYIRRKENAR